MFFTTAFVRDCSVKREYHGLGTVCYIFFDGVECLKLPKPLCPPKQQCAPLPSSLSPAPLPPSPRWAHPPSARFKSSCLILHFFAPCPRARHGLCAISSRPPRLGVSFRNFMARDCGQHAFERSTPAYRARTEGCMHAFKHSRCRRGTCANFYTTFTTHADLAASLSHTRRACSMNAI